MRKYVNFDLNLAKVKVGDKLKFDTVQQDESVISAKILHLEIDDNISINYLSRFKNGDESTTTDFFVGVILNKAIDGSNLIKQLVFRASDDTVVSTITSEYEEVAIAETKNLERKFYEEFIVDENYSPGQLLDQINAEGFLDGCIPGGYIYCGGKCGGWPACEGSVKGVNPVDNCCKSHDCCYHRYDVNYPHCYCDQTLCDCVQKYPQYVGSYTVQTVMCFVC